MDIKNMSLDKLTVIKDRLANQVDDITDFKNWFDSLNGVYTKKQVVEKYNSYDSLCGDWRGYAIRTALKRDLASEVNRIVSRTLEKQVELNEVEKEIENRYIVKEQKEFRKKKAQRLISKLDSFVEDNPNFFSDDELNTMYILIEDGDIGSEKELAKYGVE